jgi:hypothetical protein
MPSMSGASHVFLMDAIARVSGGSDRAPRANVPHGDGKR